MTSVSLAIATTLTLLTNRCSTKNNLLWHEILMILLSVATSITKSIKQKYYLSAYYIHVVTCRLQCTWTPYYKIEKEKQYKEKNCVFFLRKYFSFRILLAAYVCLISYTFEVFEKYFNLHILLVLRWQAGSLPFHGTIIRTGITCKKIPL